MKQQDRRELGNGYDSHFSFLNPVSTVTIRVVPLLWIFLIPSGKLNSKRPMQRFRESGKRFLSNKINKLDRIQFGKSKARK